MFKSIRWKFITIYFLLVFMAMIIVGVFIIQQFEEYHLNIVSENLTKLAREGLIQSIENFENLDENKEEIQQNIDQWAKGLQEEIFIVNLEFEIIAKSNNAKSSNNPNSNSALGALDDLLLVDARNGQIAEKNVIIKESGISAKNMAFPIGKPVKGILYLRADLTDIYKTLHDSKWILTEATFLALGITVVLGFLIARSVTEPIMDVTIKAAKMAKGDFNQTVEVKSDDEIGQLAEMFNYVRDKLNLTLSQISSEKSKLETILSYMADGLIAINNGGQIIHANPTAMHMLGLSQEDVQNKPYDVIMKNLNEKLTMTYIEQHYNDWIGRESIRIKDAIFHARYAPFKNEKGEKTGIVMVIQDITERQKLDNMRKEFVANVSHELKTPLTSIKSYTETLLDGALEDQGIAEHFLKVIDSEADRMNRLVQDLLQLSRLDYKRVNWNKRETDLVKLIENVVLKMTITAKNKKQEVNFITDTKEMIGIIDMDKIEQVVLNILSNAIKYTPDGGKIDIALHQQEDQGMLTIADNGIGIPEKDLPRLFERFYRVDKARSRELGGTGLGLAIAKQIVEAHQGNIQINSKEGEGTKVTITLPLRAEMT
ncbi:ATP-binding protein [Clostridiaceae bacterium 35-E11]